jgi:SAM-dependent methyltransferase
MVSSAAAGDLVEGASMSGTEPVRQPGGAARVPAYTHEAQRYDARTSRYACYRQHAVDLLPLAPGDVVLDIGCGTGLCFELLVRRVGSTGTVVGVDPAGEMLELAAQRAADRGWGNVVLVHSPVEYATLPQADHALFCAVHDVLQSAPALDHVLPHLRDEGGVAATGGTWAPASWRCTGRSCAPSRGSTGPGRSWPNGFPGSGCRRSPWAGATWPRAGSVRHPDFRGVGMPVACRGATR